MNNYNLNINVSSLKETYNNILNDITELELVLDNTYKATTTLDEKKWTSSEKTKIDQEYIPYLEKVKTGAPQALKKQLSFILKAIEEYETTEQHLKTQTENLTSGIDIISEEV